MLLQDLQGQSGRWVRSDRPFRSSLRSSRNCSGSIHSYFGSSWVWNNPDHNRIRADIRRRAHLQSRSPCARPCPGRGSPSEFFACMNYISIGYPPIPFSPLCLIAAGRRGAPLGGVLFMLCGSVRFGLCFFAFLTGIIIDKRPIAW